ncbi:MAG: hypothetical protein KAW12_30625 [Candidatus Aminicenantes bacterium]|nr:hypothetical protein [Candidatus Aminicenantes bacterium]
MKKTKILLLVLTLCLFLYASLSASTSSEFSAHKAKKIEFFLKKIAKSKKTKVFLRRGSFSEDELNSYLNLVYAKRYAPEVKYMKLKLKEKNQISGTMKVKLLGKKYKDVPSFLRDFEIEFSGTIESTKYRMRYLFEDLKINGANFSPELLDEAFGAAQGRVKDKKSLFDWFDFLPGIKKIATDYKKITFFY